MSAYDAEWLADFVTRTRRAQGLPDRIEDDACLDRIVAIFRAADASDGQTP